MSDKLTFGRSLTVEQFKNQHLVDEIFVKKNSQTNKLFFSYGSLTGAVSKKGIPTKRPMLSAVCPEGETIDYEHIGEKGCSSFWLLHEEGEGGAQIMAVL